VSRLQHLAVIMAGNGRWAEARGQVRTHGHEAGIEAVRRTLKHCRELGIRFLTLYAFSTENWDRPRREVGALMTLLCRFLRDELADLQRHGIELVAIGDVDRLPARVRWLLAKVTRTTRGLDEMRLTLALSYGGRDELVRAVRAIAQKVGRGELAPEALDATEIERHLDTRDTPPPDLIIRTGGEQRLSNFLLWQAAYAELYFTPVQWPDFGAGDLDTALAWYHRSQRRFGMV
jgi:undecaprenyl diphosphate synthase